MLVQLTGEAAFPERLEAERRRGDALVGDFSARSGVSQDVIRALLDARPEPTHASAWRTCVRFDLDRAAAALVSIAGLGSAIFGRVRPGAMACGAGLAYLAAAKILRGQQYVNRMPEFLRDGAALIRRVTGARIVVFGHTHIEEATEGYLNLGAFGDATHGPRPYLHIAADGQVRRMSCDRYD